MKVSILSELTYYTKCTDKETWFVLSLRLGWRCKLWNRLPRPATNTVADHALVLIFRPFNQSWMQPISSFATSGAASAPVIHEIVVKAVTSLYTRGAIEKNVVSDGHQTKKGAMKILKVTANTRKCESLFSSSDGF